MAKMVHTMIRVLDLDRSATFYREAFGLDEVDRFEFEGFTLAYLNNLENDFELELTSNRGREEPYEPGDGYGHLAFSVENVDAEHERLQQLGLGPRDVKELAHDGAVLAKFFFVQDPDGYDIEVLERGGRYS